MGDRPVILHLVATGRITAAEAERLLLAWNSGRASLWAIAACAALCWAAQQQLHALFPALVQLIHSLVPEVSLSAHRALALFTAVSGGAL